MWNLATKTYPELINFYAGKKKPFKRKKIREKFNQQIHFVLKKFSDYLLNFFCQFVNNLLSLIL